MNNPHVVHVITTAYGDGSGFTVRAVVADEAQAKAFEAFLNALNPSEGKVKVHEVPVVVFTAGRID